MSPAIHVENLSKQYRIAAGPRGHYRTLRDSLSRAAAAPWRGLRRPSRPSGAGANSTAPSTFWALDDVSFEVRPGEVVGIIGRNGAGKSTLLKILSRVTEPTSGRVTMHGRLASLLEVGTGFHPELTGRENIFLNGSILGMSRREIGRKLDEIVAFSEVERFLDTPVKRYSSGMYVRLAFAVAAHLDPEILVVDEVLAVGDAAFQRKCLGRLRSISREGRSVIVVSHHMATILNLCKTALLLESGRIAAAGDPPEIVAGYVRRLASPSGGEIDLRDHPARAAGCRPLLRGIRLINAAGETSDLIPCGEPLTIALSVAPHRRLECPQFGIGFDDAYGQRVFSVATYLSNSVLPPLSAPTTVYCTIDELSIAPGRYTLNLSAGVVGDYLIDALHNAAAIEVAPADFYGNGRTPGPGLGQVLVRSKWRSEQ